MTDNQSEQKIADALKDSYNETAAQLDDTEQDGASSTHTSAAETATILQELKTAEALAKENWEKFLRLQADYQNLQRRAELDIAKAHRFGLEKFVDGLIPVVDSLEQALIAVDPSAKPELQSYQEGIALTYKMFLDVLSKFQVIQLDPTGEAFNPTAHEAISMQAQPDMADGTILAVVQKGYELNGRVVRPARVVVVKN